MKQASTTFGSSRQLLLAALGVSFALPLASCGGGTPPPPINVVLSATSASVQADLGTQSFTATVQNDSQRKGVNWTLTQAGASCSAVCGTLSANTSASGAPVTYTAPSTQPNPSTVTLAATSVADTAKTMLATITVTPAIAVGVSPT